MQFRAAWRTDGPAATLIDSSAKQAIEFKDIRAAWIGVVDINVIAPSNVPDALTGRWRKKPYDWWSDGL